ncbi:unnamed protein product [Didymodactylos carnosus]|uniref:Uncharacterized protein n=1 Tax=Didymodactylos carnosus TaxID=1234261 RepID=A0A815F405_9BILA|nr:unnamed protein product [Didymodactylos carnosus]CAF1318523.1 unnamed protein product [Didymodactylos carnosus]CAF3823344.1 unnamed protein product [Didymodactylos carnosus]CAF4162149.1 unnamed protein product [Didymodactylos carnosus]
MWWTVMAVNGELKLDHLKNLNYTSCVVGVHSFAAIVLFSIETQQTIGYGTRSVNEDCHFGVLLLMVQSSVGVMIQSFVVGLVFVKISRPRLRAETLMWSHQAVVCLRDGLYTFQCRVGDMRKSFLVEAHVRMYMIKKRVTKEGEEIPLNTYDMNVGYDSGTDRVFLIQPLIIQHIINEQSPLWNISKDDLAKERFEIVVLLEGVVEATGMTTHARVSYLPLEVIWGFRFDRLIAFEKNFGQYRVDYTKFNHIYPVEMPSFSAKEMNKEKNNETKVTTKDNKSKVNLF